MTQMIAIFGRPSFMILRNGEPPITDTREALATIDAICEAEGLKKVRSSLQPENPHPMASVFSVYASEDDTVQVWNSSHPQCPQSTKVSYPDEGTPVLDAFIDHYGDGTYINGKAGFPYDFFLPFSEKAQ